MKHYAWQVNALVGAFSAGVGAFDALYGSHEAAVLMAAAVAVNGLIGRRNYIAAHKPAPRPRPDYAKIRRLEIELGMREPELKPQAPGSVFAGAYHPWSMPSAPMTPSPDDPPAGMIPGSFAEYEWRMRRGLGK